MTVTELAYVVIGARSLDTWEQFATHHLGAMTERDDQTVRVRIDEWSHRLLVVAHDDDRFLAAGWATRCDHDFAALRARLASSAATEIEDGTPDDCARRQVAGLFAFTDPSGNRHEVCWGRTELAEPFTSPTGVTGFVTGDQGMGHAVLPYPEHFDESRAFLADVLGLHCADFVRVPTPSGPGPRAAFLHTANPRQHSLAMAEVPVSTGAHHLMLEVRTLDDVGRLLDRAETAGLVRRTLGRHVNDQMVSFYLQTPAGFLAEVGYDGLRVDWATHEVRHIPRGSHWGHRWVTPAAT